MRDAWLMVGTTLLLIFLVEGGLSLASLVYRRFARPHRSPGPTSSVIHAFADADAYPDSAWVHDYYRELDSRSMEWRPYVYWHTKPFTGKYINVDADGHRFDPAAESGQTDSGTVFRIFTFGGSTMWGMGARDAFTIPALLARELRSRGVATEVTNFGEIGHVSTQEVVALVLQLRDGNVPDLVIFYDAINDAASAFEQRIAGIPINEFRRVEEFNLSNPDRLKQRLRLYQRSYLQQLAERSHLVSALKRVSRALGILPREVSSGPGAVVRESIPDELLAKQVVDRYRGNLELVTALATHYGFNCLFYWHPTMLQKTSLTEYERRMVQKQLALWRFCLRVDSVVRANVLPETSRYHFHDVSATFSSTAEPIYVDDDCHISESGNARIAEIMASDILTLVPGR